MAESITELFAIPGYSKLKLMPPGAPWTLVRKFRFRDRVWEVTVDPTGFSKGVPRSVRVVVAAVKGYPPSGITVSIEILDDSWERTVFHEERTLRGDDWVKGLEVKMSALEEASCIHNDNIPVRCILSKKKKKKKQKRAHQQTESRSNWWHRLRNIVFCGSKH
ncbi:hypothetical protein D1007_43382 [Hordeum vulgare]|nr:hypothetical protein D1007_43382 [Hordeum vulgare]